ncbi:MAG: hypothetical protein ABGY22_05155 [Acidimicrobiales bacterium]
MKVNFTLDILEGCVHACTGCFVNRRGNITDLSKLPMIQSLFNDNDLRFASIVIGPTDIFGASNTLDVLNDPALREVISNCTTVEMVSTLIDVDDAVIDAFNSIKKADGFLYGFQVVINPYDYNIEDIKTKLEHLNKFTDPLNFYIVFNMDMGELDIEDISEDIKDNLNSFIEFLPSYQRFSNGAIHSKIINKWKTRLNALDEDSRDITSMTIRDKQQGGQYELNYTLHKGKFYSTPFVYDNTIIPTREFEIEDIEDIGSWTDIKTNLYLSGLSYVKKTDDCSECERVEVCLNKHVLSYMKHYDMVSCVYPDWIKDNDYI